MNNIRIDRSALETQLSENAQLYLNDINEANLELYIQEAMVLAENLLAEYISNNANYWSERLQEKEDVLAFTDLSNGYRSQMNRWAKDNAINMNGLPERQANATTEESKKPLKMALATLLIGTGGAIGAGILTSKWVALGTELLASAAAFGVFKTMKTSEEKFATEKARIEIKLIRRKFVDCVWRDIEEWLDKAEQKSEELLTEFKCK